MHRWLLHATKNTKHSGIALLCNNLNVFTHSSSLSSSLIGIGLVSLNRGHSISEFYYICNMGYQQYLEIRPDKRFGKPSIKGTRISVYDVLNWLANGMTKQEIHRDFEELNEEIINACLTFAADKEHKLKIAS